VESADPDADLGVELTSRPEAESSGARPPTTLPMTVPLRGASRALRTPKAAAVAGIIFSVLLVVVLVIIRAVVPADPTHAATWLDDPTKRRLVGFALNLVPFAGIAFLWFIGAVRDHIGEAEDRFFATVFLGSGLLFIAMLFAGTATASGLAGDVDAQTPAWEMSRHTTYAAVTVYAMRMAAVFTISTTSITDRLGVIPRWLTIYGYASALVLMLSVGFFAWVELLFPLWVFVLSVQILRTRLRNAGADGTNDEPAGGGTASRTEGRG
jgi:hypothetical protein